MKTSLIIVLTLSTFLAAGGQILLKHGATGATRIIDFINYYIVAGLICYVLSTCIWIYALSVGKLVNVYVFTSLTFVLVFIYGIFFLRESMSISGGIGAFLVLLGLSLIISQQ